MSTGCLVPLTRGAQNNPESHHFTVGSIRWAVLRPTVDRFVTRMFETDPDFVFTVTRDFVRGCQTPILVLPDDSPAHPYAVAMESAMLAPKAEVSMFPWKEPKERIPLAVRQIHSFLKAHRPA